MTRVANIFMMIICYLLCSGIALAVLTGWERLHGTMNASDYIGSAAVFVAFFTVAGCLIAEYVLFAFPPEDFKSGLKKMLAPLFIYDLALNFILDYEAAETDLTRLLLNFLFYSVLIMLCLMVFYVYRYPMIRKKQKSDAAQLRRKYRSH